MLNKSLQFFSQLFFININLQYNLLYYPGGGARSPDVGRPSQHRESGGGEDVHVFHQVWPPHGGAEGTPREEVPGR